MMRMMNMTIEDAIAHCEDIANSKCDSCGEEHRQLAKWLKELKHHRASIRNSGDITVRELIWRLLELDLDKPIWLMDKDGFQHQLRLNVGEDYFFTGGKGYFNNED